MPIGIEEVPARTSSGSLVGFGLPLALLGTAAGFLVAMPQGATVFWTPASFLIVSAMVIAAGFAAPTNAKLTLGLEAVMGVLLLVLPPIRLPPADKPAVELAGLDRLLAMEDMKNLRLTFCRALDSHDWAALRATMADDFELYWTDTSGPNGAATRPPIEMKGADKFLTFAQQILSRGKSIHICTMPQFEYVGKDRARALWFINGYGQIGELNGLGYERVVEDYVRVGGKWLIQKANANIEVQSFTAPQGAAVPPPRMPGQ